MSFSGQAETTTPDMAPPDPRRYKRKFAYIPFRLEGKVQVLGYYYENALGKKISQRTFLVERLRGSAILEHSEKTKKSYFPRLDRLRVK